MPTNITSLILPKFHGETRFKLNYLSKRTRFRLYGRIQWSMVLNVARCVSNRIENWTNKNLFLFFWQVAWLRVDTQTILTIATHVITKNHRIAVTHSGHRRWCLHIRDTKETDRGWYMCQVNTDPMSSNTGFLEVVGNQLFIYFFFNFQLPIINNFPSN